MRLKSKYLVPYQIETSNISDGKEMGKAVWADLRRMGLSGHFFFGEEHKTILVDFQRD